MVDNVNGDNPVVDIPVVDNPVIETDVQTEPPNPTLEIHGIAIPAQ